MGTALECSCESAVWRQSLEATVHWKTRADLWDEKQAWDKHEYADRPGRLLSSAQDTSVRNTRTLVPSLRSAQCTFR